MARKAADTASEFSFANVEVSAVAELPKGTRDTLPNPLESHVKDALDQGPRAIPVPNGERAMEAQRLIRRAVTTNGYSMRLRFTDAEDKALTPAQAEASTDQVWVYFNISSEKSERAYSPRKYTNADIRAWANMEDGAKITKEIRDEYRKANGYDVRQR